MCGIFGIVGPYSPEQARQALQKLSHRGRDHCGIIEENNFFFSHQRLSITDKHHRANQPMQHGTILLSFNGEIYNHNELRLALDPFPWKTCSDAEVLLAAYERWGINCVNHLEGMFAFAIKDGDTLYLARDRFGKKPLYYMHTGLQFIFGSEIKALKLFLKSNNLNLDALQSYLSFLAPTPPHTFYEGIYKLESGEWLEFKNNNIHKQNYYSIVNTPKSFLSNIEDITITLEEELHRSIAARLNTSASTAALLSGGLDSAMICAISAHQGKRLPTYTLGYSEYENYDERKNASKTAKHLGLEHTEIILSKEHFHERLDTILDHMDEPLNDPAVLPLYFLMDAVKKDGHQVVLSGEGSDELFLGYRQYFEYLDIEKAQSLHHKNWLKKYFHAHFSMNREWEWYKRIFDDTLLFRTSGEKFTDLQQNILCRRNIKDNDSLKFLMPYRNTFDKSEYNHPTHWYSMIDLKLFVGEHFLTKLDRISMMHTLEARTPFLDHQLAELIFSLPSHIKLGTGGTKFLLKEIAKNYLTEEIITRKKKGFSNPYMEWLFATDRYQLIRDVNNETGLFYPEIIDKYLEMGQRGKFKQHVWGLYVLSHWLKKEML